MAIFNGEEIYEYKNIPITLYEIVEWWDQAEPHIRKTISDPKYDKNSRQTISRLIVDGIEKKISENNFQLLGNIKRDFNAAKDRIHKTVDSRLNTMGLNPIAYNFQDSNDIFTEAMRLLQEKEELEARKKLEEERKRTERTRTYYQPQPSQPIKTFRDILEISIDIKITKDIINKQFV